MAQKEQAVLVEANGSFLIPSGASTIPEGIDFTMIIAGEFETTITEIRIQNKETEEVFEYGDVGENYNWDGEAIAPYDYLRIPDRFRLYSINIDYAVKGVLENTPTYKAVV